jgi:hypothetical protein
MFEFVLKDHPHKVTVHGQKVQAITDVKLIAVREEDSERFIQCGYCGAKPGMPITLIKHYPQVFMDAVEEFVEKEVGGVTRVSCPPKGR